MEVTEFLESVHGELEGAGVSDEQARACVRCVEQFLAPVARGSVAVPAALVARFCALAKSTTASPASRWAALAVLARLVRAHAADDALATRLGALLDVLLGCLRGPHAATAAGAPTAAAAVLLLAAVVERCVAAAPDTRREVLQAAQRHTAALLQLLTAAAAAPAARRALVTAAAVALGTLARTAPSLVRAAAARYIQLLAAFLDDSPALSRPVGRAIGALAAAMPAASAQQYLPAVFRALVDIAHTLSTSGDDDDDDENNGDDDGDEKGKTAGGAGKNDGGNDDENDENGDDEDDEDDVAAAIMRQQKKEQQAQERESRNVFAACLAPKGLRHARADALCSRVVGLCESVGAFVAMPAPGWRTTGQPPAQSFALPAELLVAAAAALTQLTPASVAATRSSSAVRPLHHVLACLPCVHVCALQLLSVAVVVHGAALLPLYTSLAHVLLQELWLAYRAPRPLADRAFRAALFCTAARCLRAAGAASALALAARVLPSVVAELATVAPAVAASAGSLVAQSDRAISAAQRLRTAYGQAMNKRRKVAGNATTPSATSATTTSNATGNNNSGNNGSACVGESESVEAALECLETVLLCAPAEMLAVAQQAEVAGVVRALLFTEPGVLSGRARARAERCAALCALSASWTLSQTLSPLVECARQSGFAAACCDALLCPRRAPLVVTATAADAAHVRHVAAERAATAGRDVVAEQRARRESEQDVAVAEVPSEAPSVAKAPVDMGALVSSAPPEPVTVVAEAAKTTTTEQHEEHSSNSEATTETSAVADEPVDSNVGGGSNGEDDDGELVIDADAEPDADDADSD